MPDNDQALRQQDVEFLRTLNDGVPLKADEWIFNGQQWFRSNEAAEFMGVTKEYVDKLAERGEFTPQSVLYPEARIGWRLYWEDIAVYFARLRRQMQQKQSSNAS